MSQVATKAARIYRLAGAVLAESRGDYYLVGELKEPCNFEECGFEKPPESDPDKPVKYRKLKTVGPVALDSEYLEMETHGEELAELLFGRFVIPRNGSVSDRLWRAVTVKAENNVTDARWLEQMPDEVWQIVRESLLKCL